MAGRFYSQYRTDGSLDVDAFKQPWAEVKGESQFCLVNGPFGEMGRILKKIEEEHCDCILIYPDWPRGWQAVLQSMPVKAWVKLPQRRDLFTPGPRVPKEKRQQQSWHSARAAVIVWDKTAA